VSPSSAGAPTCVGLDVAVVADVFLQREARQVKVLRDLHRVGGLPLVLQVIRRPAVWRGYILI
jgi:hypothetical protein